MPLGDGVLMRAGEGCKYQLSTVGLTVVYLAVGNPFVHLDHFRNVSKFQFGVHTLRIHIERQCHDIHITGALAVAEEGTFNTVGAGQQAHLRISDGTASVVVGMQR